MAKITRYEHRANKKFKKMILKKIFEAIEQCSLWKNHGKYEKIYRHQACNNRNKMELFSARTIIQQKFFLKYIICINEKNTNIYD